MKLVKQNVIMKQTILSLLITLVISLAGNTQDSLSVLFIGNSYTYVNDLPTMLENLALSLDQGDIVFHNSQTIGGATFQSHAGNSITYDKINSQPWDFVVLQAQSQEPSFPESQVNTETLPYAIQLADSVYENKFCTDVMMFMTWGRENGDPQWAPISTFSGMNDRLRSAYMRIADSVQGSISSVGSAWAYVRATNPTINLYSADGSHPSVAGTYLAACTFYASLFRKSPVGATFIATLDQSTATILQNAAAISVLDSLEHWNLRPISEHTQAGFSFNQNNNSLTFQNESTKATNYLWDFGDGNTSTDENPVHTYLADGVYTIQLTALSDCDGDIITQEITIANLGFDNLNDRVKLLQIEKGLYRVEGLLDDVDVRVINTMGIEINKPFGLSIDLRGEPKGIYFIQIKSDLSKSFKVLN